MSSASLSIFDSVRVDTPADLEERQSIRELQEGFSILPEHIVKIQACMTSIVQKKEEEGLSFFQGANRSFAFSDFPEIVFKMSANSVREKDISRYRNMVVAKTVCRTHQLGLLVIPSAHLFTVRVDQEGAPGREYVLIAEQKIAVDRMECVQEKNFMSSPRSLDKAIRQLATFICLTGYSDVTWRNNPVIHGTLDENGDSKIALLDLEEFSDVSRGLFGDVSLARRGLLGCVVDEIQADSIKAVAERNSISTQRFYECWGERARMIAETKRLGEYYQARNIVRREEPIHLDEQALNFAEHTEAQQRRMKQLSRDLIQRLNEVLWESFPEDFIRRGRSIEIDFNQDGPLQGVHLQLIDESIDPSTIRSDDEFMKHSILLRVCGELERCGVVARQEAVCDCRMKFTF